MRTADAPPGTPDTGDATPGAHTPRGGAPGWVGALLGVLSLAAGLVVAEILTGLLRTDSSPLVEVGNRVVDLVPKSLRDWAISTFGSSDKAVLLAGVGIVLVALAVLVGTLWLRGTRTAATAIVGVVVLAGAAAPLGRGGSGPAATVSTLVGGAVVLGVLWWLGGLAATAWPTPPVSADAPPTPAVPESMVDRGTSRRRFFKVSAAVGGATAVGAGIAAWVRSNAAVAVERLGIRLPDPVEPLAAVPDSVSVGLDGVAPFITPNEDFYRIDTALVVPRVSAEDWTLRIHGRVREELTLDFPTLLDRPMIELDATIACVSNVVGGDLIGTARWLGCRLDDLLDEAGIDPSADQVVGRSVDGFTAGFPTAVLDGRDAIVAVGMNGEPLPTDHGYPARLIVPGLYGYVSATKWLSEIELTRFDEFDGYWIPRGWDREAPVVTSSRIDTPANRSEVAAGEPVGIGGVAWAMTRTIERVEVQVDGGDWEEALLGEQLSGTTWRQWRHDLALEPGDHEVAVRATDSEGVTQSGNRLPPGPNASSGWDTVTLTAV